MSVIVTLSLDTLHCIQESDRGGSSHSEPYIWPFMVAVTDNSFVATPTAAILAESRTVIRNEMHAGQSASLTFGGNQLVTTFEDSQTGRQLILVIALWEADDTPLSAVQAGFQAYLDELKRTIGLRLPELKEAIDTNNPALLKDAIDFIKAQVQAKVRSAIADHLSGFDKFQIAIGSLNPDDFMATAFALIDGAAPASFSLDFTGTAGDPRITFVPGAFGQFTVHAEQVPIHYTLDGHVTIEPVVIDPCQKQIDAVHHAEDALKGLQLMVQLLQQQLATATPQQKPGIIAMIKQINEQRIPEAENTSTSPSSACASASSPAALSTSKPPGCFRRRPC